MILIDLSTIVCSVTWPLNESEVSGGLVLKDTSLLLLGKFLLISLRTAFFNIRKTGRFLSKQGHLQPHFHSEARQLSTQL